MWVDPQHLARLCGVSRSAWADFFFQPWASHRLQADGFMSALKMGLLYPHPLKDGGVGEGLKVIFEDLHLWFQHLIFFGGKD